MQVEFIGSFTAKQELPKGREPRVAFLGRSNVGKSSLINLLTGTKIARVSKAPGRTRALNLFRVEAQWIFGDFPGYGFAAVSREELKQWQKLIEKFLTPQYFQLAIQIVDARHVGMQSDVELREWLQAREIEFLTVLNKADKLNQKERAEAVRKAHEQLSGQHLLFASTVTKEGKRELEKILGDLR